MSLGLKRNSQFRGCNRKWRVSARQRRSALSKVQDLHCFPPFLPSWRRGTRGERHTVPDCGRLEPIRRCEWGWTAQMEANSKKQRFRKGRSATFSIDGFNITIGRCRRGGRSEKTGFARFHGSRTRGAALLMGGRARGVRRPR